VKREMSVPRRLSEPKCLACPLCRCGSITLVEEIRTRDLVAMANKMLSWNVAPEFRGVRVMGFYRCNECDLQFFLPPVTGSEEYYKQYQQFDWHFRRHKEEYDFACELIRSTDRVLEIGCGKGVFAKQIATGSYVGLEFSPDAIQLAASEGVSVIKESAERHAKSHAEAYDFVCAFQVLEHVAETHSFLASGVACLKRGGLLVFSVPSADSFLAIARNSVTNLPPYHVTRWTDKCLRNVATIFGLKFVEIRHEKMEDRHRRLFASAVVLDAIETTLGTERRLVNRTLLHRALAKIARVGGMFLEKGLTTPWVVPHGPAVTAVYQKT
jgi:SAM-dependent methyltransferase